MRQHLGERVGVTFSIARFNEVLRMDFLEASKEEATRQKEVQRHTVFKEPLTSFQHEQISDRWIRAGRPQDFHNSTNAPYIEPSLSTKTFWLTLVTQNNSIQAPDTRGHCNPSLRKSVDDFVLQSRPCQKFDGSTRLKKMRNWATLGGCIKTFLR